MSEQQLPCPECGESPVNHTLTRITTAIDDTLRPLLRPRFIPRFFERAVDSVECVVTPYIFLGTVKLGMAKRIPSPDEQTSLLGTTIWNEATTRGISVWEWRLFGLARNLYVARIPRTKGGAKLIAYEGMPLPPVVDRVWWMDDKAELKPRFLKRGLPMARGAAAGSVAGAARIFRGLVAPVIAKPHAGSGSRHTTMHIADEAELARAFAISKQISPRVLIEEELTGAVYRVTVVDGKFVAALRRDKPHVVGDGIRTVRALVEQENTHPARSGPYFKKITFGTGMDRELAWQNLTVDSVPDVGQTVYLHQKMNWAVGGTAIDETDTVHPDNIALFERVAKELRAPIVGIDFIITTLRNSWKDEPRAGILECNSMPFIEVHHLPFEGKSRNVAGAVWEMVLKGE